MIIIPLKNFVLLEEIENEETTAGGIVLGDHVDQEPTYQAKVLEYGPECPKPFEGDSTMPVPFTGFKIGDIVLIQKHLFNEITLDKKKYLIGKADGIMAVLNA